MKEAFRRGPEPIASKKDRGETGFVRRYSRMARIGFQSEGNGLPTGVFSGILARSFQQREAAVEGTPPRIIRFDTLVARWKRAT